MSETYTERKNKKSSWGRVSTRDVSRRTALTSLGGITLGVTAAAMPTPAWAGATAPVTPAATSGGQETKRPRVVVIGAGIAGAATAWLLDGTCDVVLLESEEKLGGHAHSIWVNANGTQGTVDVGAQYFGPKSHPAYWKLVTKILKLPTVPAPMNMTISTKGSPYPELVSPDTNRLSPLFNLSYWPELAALGVFTSAAQRIQQANDWTTTAEEFIESLVILRQKKDKVIYPLIAAMFGVTIPHAKQMSAHAVIAFIIRGLGNGFLAPYDYHNVVNGLGSVVNTLRNRCETLTVHTSAAATKLSRQGDRYLVEDSKGQTHLADHVVMAQPPYAAGPLVGQLAGADAIARTYRRFTYNPVRIAIHADPMYMPTRRDDWSGFNALSDGKDHCEGTMWYGSFRDIKVFKSWVTYREQLPKEIIATVDFKHAHETPDFARAQTELYKHHGAGNLWFAGSHMTDVVSQESALTSAVRVAEKLAPASANLATLRAGAQQNP